MTLIKQNETAFTRKQIPMKLVDATDGFTPETGLTFSASELKVSKGGGAEANSAGSVLEIGGGLYMYVPSSGEVDTFGQLTVRTNKSGVRDSVFTAQIIAIDPYISINSTIFDVDDTVETGMTLRGALRILLSVICGKASGAGTTTETFRNAVADSKNRVVATVDSSGNRSAISYDMT